MLSKGWERRKGLWTGCRGSCVGVEEGFGRVMVVVGKRLRRGWGLRRFRREIDACAVCVVKWIVSEVLV